MILVINHDLTKLNEPEVINPKVLKSESIIIMIAHPYLNDFYMHIYEMNKEMISNQDTIFKEISGMRKGGA